MALSITHTKVSGIADVGDATLVEPSDWNASHTLTGTVSVAQGGTGTATALTAGSVVFAGVSGVYSQNNANFFWDNSSNILKAGAEIDLLVNGVFVKALYPVYNATGDNWFIGDAGNASVTGYKAIGMGHGALASLTSGTNNLGIGYGSLNRLASGANNVAIGTNAGNVATGSNNIYIGTSAGVGAFDNDDVYIGTGAGQNNVSSGANTVIGSLSAQGLTSGSLNTIIGKGALNSVTSGNNNTAIGSWVGPAGAMSSVIALSDGAGNLKLDYNYSASSVWTFPSSGINMLVNAVSKPALYPVYNAGGNNWFAAESGNATTTGNKNMGMGTVALLGLTSGSNNAAIGGQALQNCSSGAGNVAIGTNALNAISTQNNNCGIGASALKSIVGADNIGIGTNSFSATTSGSGNVGIGSAVAFSLASGSNNVFVGPFSGLNITSGSNNTLVGGWQGPSSALSSVIALSDGAGTVKLDYGNTNAATWTSAAAICITPVAVASLPSASIVGQRHFVTDATATTFASIVAGSGANKVPVYSDGTNWRIG